MNTKLHGTDPLPDAALDEDIFTKTMVLENTKASETASRPVEQLQPGSVLRDRYLLKEQVTTGSMGRVFKALDRHMTDASGAEAAVAIKILAPQLANNPNALRALQQEAAKGRCLVHPGIVRFIDLDREGELYFIVMEWLDGQSLAEVLDRHLLANETTRALEIVKQLADALEYAHQRGVIHADVKPANVMLLPDGTVKLIDFGIARVRQSGASNLKDAVIVRAATAAYSSMQVLTGEEPVASDDVFSLACLAYRVIAGHRVFGPRDAAEAAAEGMEPQRIEALSDSQWLALRKALSYSRVARQQSPRELIKDLFNPASVAPTEAPLVIPEDAVNEHRFASQQSRWPLFLLVFIFLGATAAYFLKPVWLLQGIDQVAGFVGDIKQRAAGTPAEREQGVTSAGDNQPAAQQAALPASSLEKIVDAAVAIPPAAASRIVEQADLAAAAPAQLPAVDTADTETPLTPQLAPDSPAGSAIAESAGESIVEDLAGPASLVLAGRGRPASRIAASLIEDSEPVTIELERISGLSEPLLVRVDEVGFSGRRSPGKAGDYLLSGDGVISFAAGVTNATLTISAASNTLRESDRQVSLRLRDYYDAESVLGNIDLRLLDDDQRAFEANFPVNSVSFGSERTVVRERDPAAQIEVLRYNPDDSSMVVVYYVRDGSAVEGEDYFVPTQRAVTFGPGQRNARLLISLVQDTVAEGDESFVVDLDQPVTDESTISRVTVVIRDDDFFVE